MWRFRGSRRGHRPGVARQVVVVVSAGFCRARRGQSYVELRPCGVRIHFADRTQRRCGRGVTSPLGGSSIASWKTTKRISPRPSTASGSSCSGSPRLTLHHLGSFLRTGAMAPCSPGSPLTAPTGAWSSKRVPYTGMRSTTSSSTSTNPPSTPSTPKAPLRNSQPRRPTGSSTCLMTSKYPGLCRRGRHRRRTSCRSRSPPSEAAFRIAGHGLKHPQGSSGLDRQHEHLWLSKLLSRGPPGFVVPQRWTALRGAQAQGVGTTALALREKGLGVEAIAAHLTIPAGENAGKHPSVASVYCALAAADAHTT